MRAWLIDKKDVLRTSFWFVPTLMVAGSVLLYVITINLDRSGSFTSQIFSWLYTGAPSDASTLLSALAGSSITVAGVTFSLLIAALILASSQFGPRLIRNFMRDLINQVALGIFSANFIYFLLVLRTVRGDADNPFVPHLSVTVGIGLAFISLGVLIAFIHHVALSIQVAYIVADVSHDLNISIDRIYPQLLGSEGPADQSPPDLPLNFEQEALAVEANKGGYIQVIDTTTLLKAAIGYDLLIYLKCKPGDFITPGQILLKVWPRDNLDATGIRRFRQSFILGRQRTTTQDAESDINQLVELAIRALSPAINDPFSAMMCLDRLGQALVKLAKKPFPSPYRYDAAGKLRIITQAQNFTQYVHAAFNQIRQYGSSSVSVTIRLLETLGYIGAHTEDSEYRAALLHEAVMVERVSKKTIIDEWDQESITKRYQKVLEILDGP